MALTIGLHFSLAYVGHYACRSLQAISQKTVRPKYEMDKQIIG